MERLAMTSRLLPFIATVILLAGCERPQPAVKPLNAAANMEQPETPIDPLASERDLKSLQGKWELVSLKRDWVEANEAPCYYVFDGATMTVCPKDRQPSYYTLKLDGSKSPKEMDIIATWDDGRVTKAEVIYELDGDTFRWCHVDGKRPRAFLSERNPAGTLNVVRRVRANE
jgi:uncharacterized protein (TIGR03067 family)